MRMYLTFESKHAFIWPAFLIVLAVSLFPLIYALIVSFQSVRLVPPIPPKFVGLDNYTEIIQSGRFWGSIATTATIVILSVVLQYMLGFALALALHHNVPGASLYRVAFLLPMFLAPVCSVKPKPDTSGRWLATIDRGVVLPHRASPLHMHRGVPANMQMTF